MVSDKKSRKWGIEKIRVSSIKMYFIKKGEMGCRHIGVKTEAETFYDVEKTTWD